MAEESPLKPSNDTSPLSNKRNIPLTLSSQTLDENHSSNFDKPLETLLSSQKSPKKQRSDFHGCPSNISNESLILGGVGEVSAVLMNGNHVGFETNDGIDKNGDLGSSKNGGVGEVSGNVNEVSGDLMSHNNVGFKTNDEIDKIDDMSSSKNGGVGEVSGVINEVSGGDCGEVSCVLRSQNDVGFETNGEIDKFDELGSSKNGDVGEVSGVVNQVSGDDCGEVSGDLISQNNVGFKTKDEIGDLGSSKDGNVGEVSGIVSVSSGDDCNAVSVSGVLMNKNDVSFETNDEIEHLSSSKNGGVATYSLTMEFIDDTVVVDGTKGKMVISHGVGNNVCGGGGDGGSTQKMKYSRKELEKLRFVGVKSKKKFWQKIYNGFSDDVRNSYDGLGSFKKDKQASGKNNNFRQGTLGDSLSENVVHDTRNSAHATYGDEDVAEWSGDENTDDEYYSIQRPAFMVEGEPNFESGDPEDGLEYLRRVRWEAARIPKVKVVKLDGRKVTEQSAYMPKIPDIEKCPQQFAPSKQWEDEFIAGFSDLRLALSMLWDTNDANAEDPDTILFCRPESTKHTSKNLASINLPAGGPTLSTLQAMDPVTRVALLNKRISMFETASSFSKEDCSWLFALCAVVETPLDADTSASMRCLLRRCAKLRAEKDEFDDEVVMLNILVTIAGKIFGQSEN